MFEIEMNKVRQAELSREIETRQKLKKAGLLRSTSSLTRWGTILTIIIPFFYWAGQSIFA